MSQNTFTVQRASRTVPAQERVLSFRPDLDERAQKRGAAAAANMAAATKCQAAYAAASFTTPDLQSAEIFKYRIKTVLVSALRYHQDLEEKHATAVPAAGDARSAVAALRRSSKSSSSRSSPLPEGEHQAAGIVHSTKYGPDGKPLLLISPAFVKTVCKDLETMFAPGVVVEGPKRAYESSKAQLLRLNLYVDRM